ncbi:hypothetical protein [Novosphingobium aerophilum]|uniref:Uncharacterized protein n=1 Tax=Novosphingobium aerophilum TaxID=2839843 RepID=A0A7X1F8L2_9SPHN|nr:hypothetical protein [Novosphingobium aerophilum]MBC2652363.1 hypothetical protein [Novosphingobium aerophilum]
MRIADIPGASQRAVMRGRVRVTSKYHIEITLYDFDGVFPVEVIWDPRLPSPAKQQALARKVDVALAPYCAKVLQLGRLLDGGAA